MGGRTARGRGTDRLLVRLRLARHVPRAASAVDRQARSAGVQADAGVGGLLARRPEERDAVAHLRHRLAQQKAARRAPPPAGGSGQARPSQARSEEHTSELQSLMRISYAGFCLKKKKIKHEERQKE